jgi:hypothetical protein
MPETETDVIGTDGPTPVVRTAVGTEPECERCGDPAYLTSYWHEDLCQLCVHALAEIFDERGEWPSRDDSPAE